MVLFNKHTESRVEKLDDCLVMADNYFAAFPNTLRHCGDLGRFYKYEDGYYKPMNEIAVERYFTMEAKGEFEPINYYKIPKLKQFIRRFAIISEIPYEEFNKKEMLNFENGLLDIKTGVFSSHTPSIFSTIRIPYRYDKDAQCPSWLSFLETSLEGDNNRISVLHEFMGYCLGRDNSLQKALFLLGEPGAGKGTIVRVIENMIGQENCSALSLGNMGDEASVANLVDKLVNFDADVSMAAKDFEADFRRITGGDKITAKLLWRDKFSFRPFCKLILAANELPHIADRTRAFFRRMIVIPFNVSFIGREDRNLDEKLLSEIPGILNLALEGRRRLYTNKDFTISPDLAKLVDDIKMQNNPVEMYFSEFIGFHDDCKITKNDLYKHYKDFCIKNTYHALSVIKFGKEFMRWCGPRTHPNTRNVFGNREYIWPNVFIKGVNDPVEQQVWQE